MVQYILTWNISQGGLAPPYYIILLAFVFSTITGWSKGVVENKKYSFPLECHPVLSLTSSSSAYKKQDLPWVYKKSHPLFLSFDVHICPVLAFILFPSITEECRKKMYIGEKTSNHFVTTYMKGLSRIRKI